MKISGAKSEPFSAIRRRALAQAGAHATGAPVAADTSAFLGLEPADMTPQVRAALQTLITELDDLRGEVGRLKAQLAAAEELADRDVLTPVRNRRAFVRELHRAAAFTLRYGSPASLVYFDLDGFKTVNDRLVMPLETPRYRRWLGGCPTTFENPTWSDEWGATSSP